MTKPLNAAADFDWDRLVIGSEIDAVRFALENKIHILFNRDPYVHSYERSGRTNSSLEEEWARQSYALYELSLNPFTNLVDNLRVDHEAKMVKVVTKDGGVYSIRYKELFLFDLESVSGIEFAFTNTLIGYKVLDWFDARGLTTAPFEELSDEDDFVKNIKLFQSQRVDGDRPCKDIVCESFLTREQLSSPDYSDTIARFKALNMLKKAGMNTANLRLWKRDAYPVYYTIYNKLDSIFWRRSKRKK